MRAQGEIEGSVGERKIRQLGFDVPTNSPPLSVVAEKRLHRRHPNLTQFVDGSNRTPHELATVLSSLVDYLVVRRSDALPNVLGFPLVDRITRCDGHAAARRFGIEARGAIAAA